jgi:hypothetical protein
MLYSILIGLLIIGIVFGIFQWLGWIVGVFNQNLNSSQRTYAGFFITIFFIAMIILEGYAWSKGADQIDKKRGDAFRKNNPGYYDINSINFGKIRPESTDLIQAKETMKRYDDKMANKILIWVGVYILLVIIGYVGESVFPLREPVDSNY